MVGWMALCSSVNRVECRRHLCLGWSFSSFLFLLFFNLNANFLRGKCCFVHRRRNVWDLVRAARMSTDGYRARYSNEANWFVDWTWGREELEKAVPYAVLYLMAVRQTIPTDWLDFSQRRRRLDEVTKKISIFVSFHCRFRGYPNSVIVRACQCSELSYF